MGSILGLGRGKKAAGLALQGFDFLKGDPTTTASREAGAAATGAISGALGLPGGISQEEQFKNFQESLGFQSRLEAGGKAITSSAAARGQLGSGATLKALTQFGQQEAGKDFTSFLNQLRGVSAQGQQASLGTGAAGTSGGGAAAAAQPKSTGILGRVFGI